MGEANYDVVTEDLGKRRRELESKRGEVNQPFDDQKKTTEAEYVGRRAEELKKVDGGAMGRAKLDLLEKEHQQKIQDIEAAQKAAIADVESKHMPEIKRLENQQLTEWNKEEAHRHNANLATVGADRLAQDRANRDIIAELGIEPNNPDREPEK